jgi:hypothetical protein
MKMKYLCSLLPFSLILFPLLSCHDEDDAESKCDTFSPADSVCYCKDHADDVFCKTFTSFTISLYTEKKVALTPHPSNGTLWCKGFAIDKSIYIIDRVSASPNAFWKFDLDGNDVWENRADFSGVDYGLTGAANGKGYASSYASNKFWEFNPDNNQWTPLADLPFSPGETHWVEYKGKFYVPHNDGIYEFNASTKEWSKISNQASSGFGALYLVGDEMYWYNINNDFMNRFNLADKSFGTHDLPVDFGSNVAFNSPFVLGSHAFVINNNVLWVFDKDSRTWSVDEEAIKEGGSYPDDVFVISGKAYLVDNGWLKVFEGIN